MAEAVDAAEAGFGLYLHWPFCAAKCPYCDFNSHVAARIDADRWAAAYAAEIRRLGRETPGRTLETIFLGGGTPSLMPARVVGRILDAAAAAWRLAPDLEVTLEANPSSVEAGRFAAYRAAGVNRMSIGIQALDDADLRRLGRLHSAAEAREALALAQRLFGRVSFDLIYARQDQSPAAWRRELEAALALAADHLSLYQLTIEPGTAFAARQAAGGLGGLPDEDRAAEMYEITQALCGAAGLPAYEVSNHARPGAESRHNLIYWRSGDWVAAGPGAHGRLTLDGRRWATEAERAPGAWLARVEEGGSGETHRQALEDVEAAAEYVMMGLRLSEGISEARWARLAGPLPEARIAGLVADGFLARAEGRLIATQRGRLVLDGVLRTLLG